MGKLNLTESSLEVVIKMSDGNPGAAQAVMELMDANPIIDPESVLSHFGTVVLLDDHGIYGSDIYVLWSDKCGRDTRRFIMLTRAVQLGIFDYKKFKDMSEDQARKINLTEEEFIALDEKVCERLEHFQKP